MAFIGAFNIGASNAARNPGGSGITDTGPRRDQNRNFAPFNFPRSLPDSTDDTRDAARLSQRAGDAVLEVADGSRTDIALPRVGPGAAGFLAFTGGLAALAARVRRQLEMPIVAAAAIDGKLDGTGVELDDTGAAHARHTAGCGGTRRDPRLEPADGVGGLGHRIGERPGTAARIALATRRAQRRIAGARGRGGIVSARPVVADLGRGRPARG